MMKGPGLTWVPRDVSLSWPNWLREQVRYPSFIPFLQNCKPATHCCGSSSRQWGFDPIILLIRIRILILSLLLIKMMRICDTYWSTDPPWLHFKPPLWTSKALELLFEPLGLLNFDLNLDPAFHSDADPYPDQASKNGSEPQCWRHLCASVDNSDIPVPIFSWGSGI